jgi:hypothetical protein
MKMKSKSDQLVATIAAIIGSIDWDKLDGTKGENILQQIQKGCQNEDAGKALTRWLEHQEWKLEANVLTRLGYPGLAKERLTPEIDDKKPFFDGTLIQIEPVSNILIRLQYAVYYQNLKANHALWSCIGLQTLIHFSQNPRPDFIGKRIIAWKSAFISKEGVRNVPACSFTADAQGLVVVGDIEWLDFRYVCEPQDHTMKIHA